MPKKENQKFPGFEFIESLGGIEEYKLKKNNLRVLILENHSFPVVGFMVTYLVGSRNEKQGETGFAHLLEHMAFKETKHTGKANFFEEFEKIGAELNGTTWNDRTNYFEILPPKHLELSMKAESKRMGGIKITRKNTETEKNVVLNELDWGENSPVNALEKAIWASAFVAHPYHHDTIGWRSDIENASAEALQEMYNTYYRPDNAIVVLAGNINKKRDLALLRKYFEPIKNPNIKVPEINTREPKQKGERRTTIKKKASLNIVSIAFKMPEALHPDIPGLLALSKIIGYGITSRLYKPLIEKNKATKKYIFAHPFRDTGLFHIHAHLIENTKHEEVEKIILKEIEKLKKDGITKKELDIAKNIMLSEFEFSKDGLEDTLFSINEFLAIGDWKEYVNLKSKINKLKEKDMKRIANNYLVENKKTTGWFIAQK